MPLIKGDSREAFFEEFRDPWKFKELFPDYFRLPSGGFHQVLMEEYDSEPRRMASVVARGYGKTTLGEAVIANRICYNKEKTILIVSEKREKASSFLKNIDNMVMALAEYYNIEKGKDAARHKKYYIGDRRNIINIKAAGGLQDVRGINLEAYRPTLVYVDDFEGMKARQFASDRNKRKDVFWHEIYNGLDEKIGKLWAVGTIVHEDSLMVNLLEDNEFKSYDFPCMIDGEPLWMEHQTKEKIIKEREFFRSRDKIGVWEMEKMNNPVAKEDRVFFEKDINYYNKDNIQRQLAQFTRFSVIDFAPSDKKGNDAMVISTVAVNEETEDWYVLDMRYIREQDLTTKLNESLEVYHKYHPIAFGIEMNNGGETFMQALKNEALRRETYIRGIKELTPKRTKYEQKNRRIEHYVSPVFNQGRLHFPDRDEDGSYPSFYYEFLTEIRNFVISKDNAQDDGLDTFAYMQHLCNQYGIVHKSNAYNNIKLNNSGETKKNPYILNPPGSNIKKKSKKSPYFFKNRSRR